MTILKELPFTLLEEKAGYGIYYTIIKSGKINTANQKTVMFVIKDNLILFTAPQDLDQFHMKLACEEFVDNLLEEENNTGNTDDKM